MMAYILAKGRFETALRSLSANTLWPEEKWHFYNELYKKAVRLEKQLKGRKGRYRVEYPERELYEKDTAEAERRAVEV